MIHMANRDNIGLILTGKPVNNSDMSESDLDWAMVSDVIKQDNRGRWYHSGITKADRARVENFWDPDTGPWRKGVNY